MRKIISILFILLISLSLFGAIKNELSKPVTLQAGFGNVSELYVTPISTQSQGFMIGMPFNIEDPNVQFLGNVTGNDALSIFGSGSGRIIADWNMLFNAPVDIKIEADNLMPTNSKVTYNGDGLSYSLAFSFTLSYSVGSSVESATGYIVYEGVNKCTYIWDYDNKKVYPEFNKAVSGNFAPFSEYLTALTRSDGLVGNVDGKVIFGFTSNSTNEIKNNSDNLPYGEYRGDVRIYVEAKQ